MTTELLHINSKKIALTLFGVATSLLCIFVLSVAVVDDYGASAGGVLGLFNLNNEASIPTWFSQSLLLLAAMTLFVVASGAKSYRKHWYALSAIFAYLSVDEGASIHELTVMPIRETLDLHTGFFYYSWVLLFGVLTFVIGLFYITFLNHLQKRTRFLFIVAATLFVGGGIGMEMIGGKIAAVHGESGAIFALIVAGEEYLEMSGVTLFIYAVLDYAMHQQQQFLLRLK